MRKLVPKILCMFAIISVMSSCNQNSSNSDNKTTLRALDSSTLNQVTGTWTAENQTETTSRAYADGALDRNELGYFFFNISADAGFEIDLHQAPSHSDKISKSNVLPYLNLKKYKIGSLVLNSANVIELKISAEAIALARSDKSMTEQQIQNFVSNPYQFKVDQNGNLKIIFKTSTHSGPYDEMQLVKVDSKKVFEIKQKSKMLSEILDSKIQEIMTNLKGKTFKMIDVRTVTKINGLVSYDNTLDAKYIPEADASTQNGYIYVNAKSIKFEDMYKVIFNTQHVRSVDYVLSRDLSMLKLMFFTQLDETTTASSGATGFIKIIDSSNFNLENSYISTTEDGKTTDSTTITRYSL